MSIEQENRPEISEEALIPEMEELSPHGEQARQREKLLGEKRIPPLVISFVIPTMIAMMVNAIYNIVDRFWIGKMSDGALAMAGVGITLPLSTLTFSFMALIGIGSTALISIKLGEKSRREAERVLGNCASVSFGIGLILAIIGLVFAEPLLKLFGASEKTLPFAMEYIVILLAFNAFNSFQFSMSAVMRGVGHPVWAVMTQVIGAVTNIILDPIFIFKPYEIELMGLKLPPGIGLGLGVKGAAWATVIAQMVSFSIVCFYYLRGKSPVHLKFSNFLPQLTIVKKIMAIGSSSFALNAAASLVQIVANLQLARFGGDMAVSAMTLINSIAMFCIMPIIGINQGIQPIIGFNYGAKKYSRVRSTYVFAVGFASALTITFAVLIQLFPENIVMLFNDEPELIDIAVSALRIILFMMPALGFQIVSANYFQFVGKSFVALVMTLLRQIILLIPLYLILPHFLGLQGIWLASPISDSIAILITITVISRELLWLNKKIAEQKIHYVNVGLD